MFCVPLLEVLLPALALGRKPWRQELTIDRGQAAFDSLSGRSLGGPHPASISFIFGLGRASIISFGAFTERGAAYFVISWRWGNAPKCIVRPGRVSGFPATFCLCEPQRAGRPASQRASSGNKNESSLPPPPNRIGSTQNRSKAAQSGSGHCSCSEIKRIRQRRP